MAIGDAPKPKTPLTEKEAGIAVVNEILIDVSLKFFSIIEKEDPEWAATLKPDFDEYLKVQMEVAQQENGGRVLDVEKRIPNNRWLKLVKEVAVGMSRNRNASQIDENAAKGFQDRVVKKIKGEDIN